MKELYICNTVYHVMVVCCIRKYLNSGGEATLWISDHTNQAETVCHRMRQTDCGFSNIQYIKTKVYQETEYTDKSVERACMERAAQQLRGLEEDFSHIYMTNFDFFFCALLQEWADRDITYSMYEDGLGTYSYEGNLFAASRYRSLADTVHDIYVFYPDKMSWQAGRPVHKIPCRLDTDIRMKQDFGRIFSYDTLTDRYDARFIFFEDGFAEWENDEDLRILEAAGLVTGKDQIFVKTHPRNESGKYQKAGFAVNADTCVPWEVISMHIPVERKVLITFYSQAVIMPLMLSGARYRAVILSKILCCADSRAEQYFQYMDQYFYSVYPDIFFVPESVEQLTAYLENCV